MVSSELIKSLSELVWLKKTVSGIRGVFGEDLDLTHVLEFCSNFTSMIGTKCVIGRDTRPSGCMVMDAASAALMANGVDIHNLGMVPTPVVFREARGSAGLVISSSHNPLEWNGIKFIINGRGINEQELQRLIRFQKPQASRIGSEYDATSSYAKDAAVTIGEIGARPEVVVDIGGGAARWVAPDLLTRLGCSVRVINEESRHRGPDPTTDSLSGLVSATVKGGIGFAFDLDGDRLVVVKDGKKQSPDVTLGLGVARSLGMGCKRFVLSVDTSMSIEKIIIEGGGTVVRSKVGEANVVDQMLGCQAHAGGEGSSGGFILSEFNYCRDGILASGMIASMLDKPEFDEVLEQMEGYRQIREKVYVPSEIHDVVIERLKKMLRAEFSETDMQDGIKGIIDENSWVLVRKSNTEDTIKISAESDNHERCEKIVENASRLVRRCCDDAV